MNMKRYGESIAATPDGCDFKLLPVDEPELGLWVKAADYDALLALARRLRDSLIVWSAKGDPDVLHDSAWLEET
jgi:hypothetical protein